VGQVFKKDLILFLGCNPASSSGGISSLVTSPIGTQTGLQLGHSEMSGGPGSKGFGASPVTDPGVATRFYFCTTRSRGHFYL
jgi:hypothetical protein